MALRHIGTDPDSGFNGSPTVWVDEDDSSLVLHGWRITDEATPAHIPAKGEIPGHEPGLRLRARTAPFLREAIG